MPRPPRRFSALLIAFALQSSGLLMALPARAASALAAWSLGSDGVLQLRTATGALLDAFFEAGEAAQLDPPVLPRLKVNEGFHKRACRNVA